MLVGCDHNDLRRPELSDAEPAPRVLAILSFVLEKLVARNDQLVVGLSEEMPAADGLTSRNSAGLGKRLNAFHGVRAPAISIAKYLERIYKFTNCSPSCFVVGFVYIDRVVHRNPDSLVVSLNVHRLLVTSVMVASKMLDDV
ncbi:Cyclin-U1-1 [Sarracenia purpurea var. burkii]